MRRRHLILVAGVLAVIGTGWSLFGPWAAAFPLRPDRYEVTLFGVSNISDMSPTAAKKTCGWYDPVAPCFPAADEAESYASLARAVVRARGAGYDARRSWRSSLQLHTAGALDRIPVRGSRG